MIISWSLFQNIFIFATALTIALVSAQRPTYAGQGPKGRPGLANRFKDPNETTTVGLVNRLGEDGGTTAKIPVDARGDGELVDRLNQWPREHQPFWLLNAGHIEASRNPQNNLDLANRNNFNNAIGGGPDDETRPIRPLEQRSSFLGLRPF